MLQSEQDGWTTKSPSLMRKGDPLPPQRMTAAKKVADTRNPQRTDGARMACVDVIYG